MHCVLYTPDLEPITVLFLKPGTVALLKERGRIEFEAPEPLRLEAIESRAVYQRNRRVLVWAERFRYREVESMILFTNDEETALMLRSDFLPGQRRSINEANSRAYARGFVDAINAVA